MNSTESSPVVVEVSHLSKAYNIWVSPAARLHGPLLGRLGQLPFTPPALAERLRQLSHQSFKRFYALSDVSFRVHKGEMLGIIGRNGSGKSTLLQILAGTLAATAGTATVQGRVSALLELGAGFTPEFTGRENVFLNGRILGLSAQEVESRYAEIVAFADIGEFIDHPVKMYSSGMYVRLAFAVAIHLDADVLIVDEALAVGDEAFQRKCYARIRAFQERGGTILFVSHSATAVVELCSRAVLLDQGELLLAGEPKAVVTQYHKLIYAPAERAAALREELRRGAAEARPLPGAMAADAGAVEERSFQDPGLVPQSTVFYESRGALIDGARVVTPAGRQVNVLQRRQDYVYEYAVRFTRTCFNVRFGMLIKTVTGMSLGGAVSSPPGRSIDCVEAHSTAIVRFRFRCLLTPAAYFLNAGVLGTLDGEEVFLHRAIDVAMVRVQAEPEDLSTGNVDFSITPEVLLDAPASQATAR